ncbi:tripartite tricarboxylate transporter substrate binding protein [Variovorax sp. J22G73]|jgi:tripartite-type tricarboxylate transporter receptor subunit TctC|uniref:tripartite tricarboxylate transporter substrate binding protein n=1 Tax=unclassified Variovorax TaxID=663243 RepID=UPI002574B09B|nr:MULTISPECIES: tripartite tricarboxylate transporter substrate binding protein [unclassified Variovorax]MDM0004866.1 tripartite tricarboxylate transporter substrate binding protein [Variovorax sp. J22R203]MDM0098282.1 tripartite tricarboxylate transporter substrate binding protein [Variovorax sp. J22G73]
MPAFTPFRALAGALALSFTVLAPPAAWAAFPDKPLHIVVPFAPGGGTDAITRSLGVGMSQALGQPVIVDNKPGAGTIIGSEFVAKSAPDGYTLVMATFAHAVNPGLQPKMPYDTDKAFAPVALIGVSPNVLVVRAESPYKTVAELVAAAKATPGKLTFASQGNGTSAHLAGELFKNLAKVELTHIPYRGAGPAMTDLLGGQVDMMFATASAVRPFVDSGKMRALGVTTARRSPAYASVPTLAEAGVPGYAAESWYGLYVAAKTPKDVIDRLNAAVKKAVKAPAFAKQTDAEGLAVDVGAPEQLDTYVRAEEVRWRKVVKDNHITTD